MNKTDLKAILQLGEVKKWNIFYNGEKIGESLGETSEEAIKNVYEDFIKKYGNKVSYEIWNLKKDNTLIAEGRAISIAQAKEKALKKMEKSHILIVFEDKSIKAAIKEYTYSELIKKSEKK